MNNSLKESLKIIPLGGLGEVGRNMMVIEWKDEILIIDMGFRMPEENMPGVDYIIPNVEYLKDKKEKIKGVIFTHGHYDHIGAIPYLLPKIWHPHLSFFASPLTKAIILKRQEEFKGQPDLKIQEIYDKSEVKIGPFLVEFVKMNHNIPDNFALFIKTPIGNIFHTSDFKFDHNPINDKPTDFKRLETLSKKKILLLMSDSTDAEEEGHSLSESEIHTNLEEIMKKAKGRIITATFASLINRIQQIITISEKYERKVAIEGYSMRTNVEIAKKLGYIKVNPKTLIPTKEIENIADNRVTILCTGAQGEPDAVLMRIITKQHPIIKLKKGDSVIFSSSVIPGNERNVQIMKDEILRQGADVFHYRMMDIHAGGHPKREELRQIIKILKPRFFMPIHGQYSMLISHAKLANAVGIKEENTIVVENGDVVNLSKRSYVIQRKAVPSNYIMVDGLGIGDVGEVVLRDRKMLAKDGIFVVIAVVDRQTGKVIKSPDIISRGFIYLKESKELLKNVRKKIIKIVEYATGSGKVVNWTYVKDEIKEKIGEFLFSQTQRRPMVLPVVIEV